MDASDLADLTVEPEGERLRVTISAQQSQTWLTREGVTLLVVVLQAWLDSHGQPPLE